MFYSCRSPIQNCNASFRLPQWTVTAQSLASWQFSIDVEYLNKSRLQLCCLTGAELSAAGWTAVSLFFSLVQSFETLEVFDLEAVDLSWWIQSADSGGCDCYIWTQLQSYGFFFYSSLRSTFSSHLDLPTFMFIHGAPSEGRVTPCMCPLCCFACCHTGNGPWQADSWLPRCPPWSAVVCCTVSHCHRGSPVWTLTGYFGLKFQHPSVKPNKHYLKGQHELGEKHR